MALLIIGCTEKYKTKEDLYNAGIRLMNANDPGGAIIFFKNALEKDQNYFEARLQLAKAYSSVGKLDSSEKEFQKVLRQNPASRDARIGVARVYLQKTKYGDALREMADFIGDARPDGDVLEIAGLAHALKGDYSAAVLFLKKALAAQNPPSTAKASLIKAYMTMGDAAEAKLHISEILKKDPSDKSGLSLLAELQTKENDTDAAIMTYERLLRRHPSDAEAYLKKGVLYLEKGRYDEALLLADKLIATFPRKGEGYRLKGVCLFQQKKLHEAVTALRASLSLQPSVGAYYVLGLCHYYKNEPEQALEQLQKTVELNPSFIQGRVLVSLLLLKKNRVDDAISEIKKALEKDERNALSHNILGSALMAKGMSSEGIAELNKALALDPNLADAHIRKGLYEFSKGRARETETELNAAVRINPELLNSRVLLASYYMNQSAYEKAIQILTKGLRGEKADGILYTLIGEAFLRQNKMNDAVTSFKKAKATNPSYDPAYFNLASLHFFRGEQEQGIQELRDLTAQSPGNVHALLSVAGILESKGREKEALTYYVQAKNTGSAEGYVETAKYYLRQKKPDEAVSVLDEAARKNPSDVLFLYELKGKALLAQKKFDDAVKTFEEVEKINPKLGLGCLANAYIVMNKPDKALERVRRELKKHPEQFELMAEVSGIFMVMGRKQDAIETAKQIIRKDPTSSVGYAALALVYQEGKEFDKAIAVLRGASGIKDVNLSMMLGNLYALKKEYAFALEQYRKAEKADAGYVPALTGQGAVLHAMGKKKEAIAEYRKVLRFSRNHVSTLNNLAYLYAEDNRDLPAALQLAATAYTLAPKDGSVQDTLGFVLLKKGKAAEGLALLKKAAENVPDNPTIYYHLALAYQELRENPPAIANLRKAIGLGSFPELEGAKILLARLNGNKGRASR